MSNTNEFLNKIQKHLNGNISQIELSHLNKDLETVLDRLEKDEYKKSGFNVNKFNVPDRTREFYIYLQFYCEIGQNWTPLLKAIDINKYKEVVDLCPGYTPKIELALFYSGYKGKVIAIDKDIDSPKRLVKFMELFNPPFKTIPEKIDLFDHFKSKYKVIIGNHIIDDLVVDLYCKKWGISKTEIYEKEGAITNLWAKILKDKDKNLAECLTKLVDIFERITAKNGIILMSQYKSYMEKLLNLDEAARFSRTLFKMIIKELCKIGFVNEQNLVQKALKNYKGHFGINDCCILRKL
jgi:hypothetical protein